MRRYIWIGLSISSFIFVFLGVVYPYLCDVTEAKAIRAAYLVVPAFLLQPFGALWMVYQAIRREVNPMPFVLIALFIPFAFVWYYFERVTGKQAPRQITRGSA